MRARELERDVREKEALEKEMMSERDRNSILQQERERLQQVAKDSCLAQNGLRYVTSTSEQYSHGKFGSESDLLFAAYTLIYLY